MKVWEGNTKIVQTSAAIQHDRTYKKLINILL